MNKQQLQQEIAELQKQLEEKQKALSAMPEKWEPKGGEWLVDLFGEACTTSMMAREISAFGASYTTREQAEKASKAMRAHNRLLAYVAEFAPDWELGCDKGVERYYVYFDLARMEYAHWYDVYTKNMGTVYMPENVAIELASKLNSGEVEL